MNDVNGLYASETLNCNDLCINHLKFVHFSRLIHVKELANESLITGYVPSRHGLRKVIPLKKGNLDNSCDSANYRPKTTLQCFEICVEQ